ncbi:MAG: YbaN family protein [Candidatus Neomarinimicrobiota bacterium]
MNPKQTKIKTTGNPIIRNLLIIAGFVSLILGIIGVVLPLLPTTPFILVSAAAFARSSKKFHAWLYKNRFFAKLLIDYQERKGLALRYKIYILIMLWLTITATAILFTDSIIVRLILFFIAIAVTVHISKFKTLKT